jgi:plastocyanin
MKRNLERIVFPACGFLMLLGIALMSGCGSNSGTGTPSSSGSVAAAPTSSNATAVAQLPPVVAPVVDPANVTSPPYAIAVDCPPTGTIDITIQDALFSPQNITVSLNSIVRWTSNSLGHDIYSGPPPGGDLVLDSGAMKAGGTFCAQFQQVGSFPYFDCNNPDMIGTVTVQ